MFRQVPKQVHLHCTINTLLTKIRCNTALDRFSSCFFKDQFLWRSASLLTNRHFWSQFPPVYNQVKKQLLVVVWKAVRMLARYFGHAFLLPDARTIFKVNCSLFCSCVFCLSFINSEGMSKIGNDLRVHPWEDQAHWHMPSHRFLWDHHRILGLPSCLQIRSGLVPWVIPGVLEPLTLYPKDTPRNPSQKSADKKRLLNKQDSLSDSYPISPNNC